MNYFAEKLFNFVTSSKILKIIIIFTLFINTNCGEGMLMLVERQAIDNPTSPQELVSIEISPTAPSLTLGINQQFTATANFSDLSTSDVTSTTTWTSSDTTVAIINASGLAQSLAQGTTTITANYNDKTANTVLTITASDPPTLSIDNVSVAENAGTAQFTVTLSEASGQVVTVDYSSLDDTAVAGSDYTAVSSNLTFNPGETTKDIYVTIADESTDENDETFNINLSNAGNATIGTGTGVGTITNDDTAPLLSIYDVSVAEDAGTAQFTVTLSEASGKVVTVDYSSLDDTAVAGSDYTVVSSSLTFNPGETTKTIDVTIINESTDENDETYNIILSNESNATIDTWTAIGTITNDDTVPSLSINNVSVVENAGTAQFTVILSEASSKIVQVNYDSADDTALAGNDYTAVSSTLTFNPGITTQTINVNILNESTDENNETYNINLSGESNAAIGTGTGVGTITDDDNAPTISFSSGSSATIDESATLHTFDVVLSEASGKIITVDVVDAGGTAISETDYSLTKTSPETLTFSPGQTVKSVSFTPIEDEDGEGSGETVIFTLTNELNAVIGTPSGHTATITDDDLKTGDATTYTITGAPNFTMVYVEAGLQFMQGIDNSGDIYDWVVDPVEATVTTAYEIGETEVTYELWKVVHDWATHPDRGANQYNFPNSGTMGDGVGDTNQHPVTEINWRDSIVWCNALTEYYNAQEGQNLECVYTSDSAYNIPLRDLKDTNKNPYYFNPGELDNPYVNPNAKGFRLPTAAEIGAAQRWEGNSKKSNDAYESPSGQWWTSGNYVSGDLDGPSSTSLTLDDYAWHDGNSGSSTHIVKDRLPNALGLYDMSGNVFEWIFDWHPDNPNNPGNGGTWRGAIGGSWYFAPYRSEVGYWDGITPMTAYNDNGLRIVRTR